MPYSLYRKCKTAFQDTDRAGREIQHALEQVDDHGEVGPWVAVRLEKIQFDVLGLQDDQVDALACQHRT